MSQNNSNSNNDNKHIKQIAVLFPTYGVNKPYSSNKTAYIRSMHTKYIIPPITHICFFIMLRHIITYIPMTQNKYSPPQTAAIASK